MDTFRVGDFVKVRDLDKQRVDRVFGWSTNIFEIRELDGEIVQLDDYLEKLLLTEVESIPINGIDDKDIYFDPIRLATFVRYNEPVPVHRTDYTYYLEVFERCEHDNMNLQDLIRLNKLEFVHQVQHYLMDEVSPDWFRGLKIHKKI